MMPSKATIRLILLPPAMASAEDYVQQGFVAQIQSHGLPLAVTCLDIGYEAVMAGKTAEVVWQEAVATAVAAGETIWLGGISLGAFNALQCAASYPEVIARLVLLAPYPGTADVVNAVRQQEGVPADWWQDNTLTDERKWWGWLASPAPKPVIDLMLSEQDRFRTGQQCLQTVLPATNTLEVPGKHEWPVWQQLWQAWCADRVREFSVGGEHALAP